MYNVEELKFKCTDKTIAPIYLNITVFAGKATSAVQHTILAVNIFWYDNCYKFSVSYKHRYCNNVVIFLFHASVT